MTKTRRELGKRIASAQSEKATLEADLAKIEKSDGFRTAMEFLLNPCKLWHSDDSAHKRLVLKLTFAERLAYARNHGFRTAVTSLPFTVMSGQSDLKEMVVEGAASNENVSGLGQSNF